MEGNEDDDKLSLDEQLNLVPNLSQESADISENDDGKRIMQLQLIVKNSSLLLFAQLPPIGW